MIKKNSLFGVVIIGFLVVSNIWPVWAAQLDAIVSTRAEFSEPTFRFLKTVFIEYQDGGMLSELLKNKDIEMSFEANIDSQGIPELIEQINHNLSKDLSSTIFVSDLKLIYRVHLVGHDDQTAIDYKLILVPKMTNYVLSEATDSSPAIIDSHWRGITVKVPVIIKTKEFGEVEINEPYSFLLKEIPEVAQMIKNTNAEALLKQHMIDSGKILTHPLSKWHDLFDPTAKIQDSEKFGLNGEKLVITNFAFGETSIDAGIWKASIAEAQLELDQKYEIRIIEAASSARIQIDGYVSHKTLDGVEYFVSYLKPPSDIPLDPNQGFPVMVLYGMAGAGGAVAVVILFWSDRKLKKNESKNSGW